MTYNKKAESKLCLVTLWRDPNPRLLLAQWCISSTVLILYFSAGQDLYLTWSISTLLYCCCSKVITFQEPLKPFIAIVVEVVVLVAAILLYEKSRSKKTPTAGSQTANFMLYVSVYVVF